jgi:hypothetical protein
MNAIARQDQLPGMPEPLNMMEVISRAAADPNVDVDKMQRLMEMFERIQGRNAKTAYAAALAQMQEKLPIITERGAIKNRDGAVQSTYALWEDLNEAIRPILAEHGFSLTFRTGSEGTLIKVTGVLSHREGHSEETSMPLPPDASGSKNAVQAVASSISYGKRYTACALLNITSRGEDDDGQKAGGGETLTEREVADLKAVITEVGADQAKLLKLWRVTALDQILRANYQTVMDLVKAKRR